MAIPISGLPTAGAIAGTEVLPVVQSSTTDKVTVANLTPGLNVMVASGASHKKGLAPDPGAVSGTAKYLREDATWVDPRPTRGKATLSSGAVVVSTAAVTSSSLIWLTVQVLGTVVAPKAVAVTARSAGVSFTITSADGTDTSDVAWQIIEP
jgi:hypothetical protein